MSALDDAIAKLESEREAQKKPTCECGNALVRVSGRRRGTSYWWCPFCEKARKPEAH